LLAVAGIGLLIAGCAQLWVKYRPVPDSATYQLIFEMPKGWTEVPQHPGSIFLYRDPKEELYLRGAALSLVSDVNPTPEMNTDVFASDYTDVLDKRMPEWKSEVLDTIPVAGVPFRLVRRAGPNHYALIAVCVRGNSTFSVMISSDAKHRSVVDKNEPWFRDYVASLNMAKESPNWSPK